MSPAPICGSAAEGFDRPSITVLNTRHLGKLKPNFAFVQLKI